MSADSKVGYKVTPDFEVNDKNSLLEISMDPNKELWLIQMPKDQSTDFSGQEVSLQLHVDGKLGSFQSSSGKAFELVSFASQDPNNASVFQSSKSNSKVVGKISRRVSLVHYPDPNEPYQPNSKIPGQLYPRSVGTSSMGASHRHGSATLGSGRSGSGLSHVTMTPPRSSKRTKLQFEIGGSSRSSKKKHSQRIGSINQSQDSVGRVGSGVSSLGSAGHSQEGRKIKHGE